MSYFTGINFRRLENFMFKLIALEIFGWHFQLHSWNPRLLFIAYSFSLERTTLLNNHICFIVHHSIKDVSIENGVRLAKISPPRAVFVDTYYQTLGLDGSWNE